MRKLFPLLLCLSAAAARAAVQEPPADPHPQWQRASSWPDRVIATLPGDPQHGFAVTWRTDTSVSETVAQIALAGHGPDLTENATTISARTELVDLENVTLGGEPFVAHWNTGLGSVAYHSASFENLQPDTLYAYRVRGGDGEWSAWNQLRTAPEEGPLTFIYMGDAQNDILSGWSRVIRQAFATAPDARFIVHAGDLVNRAARDSEWAEWFRGLGFIHTMIPAIPVTGNHEYMKLETDGRTSGREFTMLWRPQFTLPEEAALPSELRELAYDVRYSRDLHVFVVASMEDEHLQAQAEWLDRELAASDARWRIVSFHHPIFSSGENRDSPEVRESLLPVFLKHEVDLVLQGNDHTYARGAISAGGEHPSVHETGDQIATMFVNSVGGPKQYAFKANDWGDYAGTGVRLARSAEDMQLFQIVHIDGDTLHFESRTATGAPYDDFTLRKGPDGRKVIAATGRVIPEHRRND